ncbi:MAG: DUF481 domain-containing protein [Verrucomicrobia bacterium]|nr:DUF481 domain-containing protein [Verrucomicrobiota bacterium]
MLAGCASSVPAQEVLLQLRNGDRLTGTILRDTTNAVTIDLPFVGTLDIPGDQIKRRKEISARAAKKMSSSSAKFGAATPVEISRRRDQLNELLAAHRLGKIAAADYLVQRQKILSQPFHALPGAVGASVVATTNAPPAPPVGPVPAKPASVASATPAPAAKPPPRKLWKFDAQFGVNLQYNQHHIELYQSVFNVHYGDAQSRYREHFNLTANRGRTDGVQSANNVNGLERTEVDVAKRVFLFNAFGAGYDEVRKIDLSYEDSLGIGYTVWKRPNLALSFDTGANYQEQFFADHSSKDYFSPRLGEKATWKISSKLDLDEVFEVFPRSLALDNYRLRFEGTLRYSLSAYLSLNLRVVDLHDTQPAAGVTPNDLQITSTIGVRF